MSTIQTNPTALDKALAALRNGKMVILVDDEDSENEGDLIMPAQFVRSQDVNFYIKNARGLVCLVLEGSRVDQLALTMMAPQNRSPRQTAFTVSIEAREGVSTGISAADRAHTIRTAIDPNKTAYDIVSPGHIFPLRAQDGGTLVRAGHTEGSLDLMKLAGLEPSAMICEIMNDDGTMSRRDDLIRFSKEHGDIPIVSIKEIIAYRMAHESLVELSATTKFPSEHGEFKLHAFLSKVDGTTHLALVKGDGDFKTPALVRVHSECLTGDALFSKRCDCGDQLEAALKLISESGNGVLIYMRRHEGRGIGLSNKIKAYALQDGGLDTVEANRHLGFKPDLRHYGIGAQILRALGITQMKLLTNNPVKVVGLEAYGLEIIERLPIEVGANPSNLPYLATKRDKMGHQLSLVDEVDAV
jgi:3,4-dihydroxy 2-butanone 4-phosphate synthase/GTP cyclohydrolase II